VEEDDSDENGGNSLSNILFKISSSGGKQEDEEDSDSSEEEEMFENTAKIPLAINKNDSSSDEDNEAVDEYLAANYSSNYGAAAVAPVVQVYQEEKPEYHAQFFWKPELQVNDVVLDDLLLDYE
jgi:hypothetical protein